MSLPSSASFFKEGKEIHRKFINCGWFVNENSVKTAIKRTIMIEDISEEDWDSVEAYGQKYEKSEILK